ncbi:MAG: hypothetical protein DCF25_07015 [Leptolyngbya foveolarum]|uniref:DUF4160 domain-containing protein n=1 Tax=Leptolyngbya foveolarum TaxID=47253 RepID=A0A2W4UGT5_9CYAN|nr:MAG: hypothetical protein DCF25_07015 [Leptolyngbya foveolarum]
MGNVLTADGFRFFMPSNDHEPNHVHVEKGEFATKIDISGDQAILMKGEESKRTAKDPKLRKKALRLANTYLQTLKEEWRLRQ